MDVCKLLSTGICKQHCSDSEKSENNADMQQCVTDSVKEHP